MKAFFVVAGLTAAGLIAGTGGCADEIDEAVDCAQVCQRYDDCIDEDYDVTECVDRCEQRADEDERFADRADACEACLDERSCAESFPCVDECLGIVP